MLDVLVAWNINGVLMSLALVHHFRKMNFLRAENMPRNLVKDFQFILAHGIILSQHCSSPRFLDALPQAVQGAGPVS